MDFGTTLRNVQHKLYFSENNQRRRRTLRLIIINQAPHADKPIFSADRHKPHHTPPAIPRLQCLDELTQALRLPTTYDDSYVCQRLHRQYCVPGNSHRSRCGHAVIHSPSYHCRVRVALRRKRDGYGIQSCEDSVRCLSFQSSPSLLHSLGFLTDRGGTLSGGRRRHKTSLLVQRKLGLLGKGLVQDMARVPLSLTHRAQSTRANATGSPCTQGSSSRSLLTRDHRHRGCPARGKQAHVARGLLRPSCPKIHPGFETRSLAPQLKHGCALRTRVTAAAHRLLLVVSSLLGHSPFGQDRSPRS